MSTLKIGLVQFLFDVEKKNSIFHAAVHVDVLGGGGGWFTHVCFEQVRPYTTLVSTVTHGRALMNINYRERERNPRTRLGVRKGRRNGV